jgi:hypothetical protein
MKNRMLEPLRPASSAARPPSKQPQDPASETQDELLQRVAEFGIELKGCIRNWPGVSLAVAVACGVIIGWIVKRR